jgi:crotonobetaine/carnitine-CoA ligase
MMQGYIGMPKETLDAWRNLWFHTGDAGYFDADGNLYFVERLKDRIRSRSENISSYDIEVAALAVPGVSDAAAVGVPSGYEGDDDIKLFVVYKGQEELTPTDLLKALARKLPHFMLPRYIEIVDHLPRTPTAKVMKKALREMGNHSDTWDRKADGLRLRDLYE